MDFFFWFHEINKMFYISLQSEKSFALKFIAFLPIDAGNDTSLE